MRFRVMSLLLSAAIIWIGAPADATVVTFTGTITGWITTSEYLALDGYYIGDTYFPEEVLVDHTSSVTSPTQEVTLLLYVPDDTVDNEYGAPSTDALGTHLTWETIVEAFWIGPQVARVPGQSPNSPISPPDPYSDPWDSFDRTAHMTRSNLFSGGEGISWDAIFFAEGYETFAGSGSLTSTHNLFSFGGGGFADSLGNNHFEFSLQMEDESESIGPWYLDNDRGYRSSRSVVADYHLNMTLQDWDPSSPVVPEPATGLLMGVGLMAFARRVRCSIRH